MIGSSFDMDSHENCLFISEAENNAMGMRVLGTFPQLGDWHSRSSTGLLEVDLQYVTVTKIMRTGVDWRYCTPCENRTQTGKGETAKQPCAANSAHLSLSCRGFIFAPGNHMIKCVMFHHK